MCTWRSSVESGLESGPGCEAGVLWSGGSRGRRAPCAASRSSDLPPVSGRAARPSGIKAPASPIRDSIGRAFISRRNDRRAEPHGGLSAVAFSEGGRLSGTRHLPRPFRDGVRRAFIPDRGDRRAKPYGATLLVVLLRPYSSARRMSRRELLEQRWRGDRVWNGASRHVLVARQVSCAAGSHGRRAPCAASRSSDLAPVSSFGGRAEPYGSLSAVASAKAGKTGLHAQPDDAIVSPELVAHAATFPSGIETKDRDQHAWQQRAQRWRCYCGLGHLDGH